MFLPNTGRNCKKCHIDQNVCAKSWFNRNIYCKYRLIDPLNQIENYIFSIYRSTGEFVTSSSGNPKYVAAKIFSNMVQSIANNGHMVDFERLSGDSYSARIALTRNLIRILNNYSMEERRYDNLNIMLMKEFDDSPRYQLSTIEKEGYSKLLIIKDLVNETEIALDCDRLNYRVDDMLRCCDIIGTTTVSKNFIEGYGFKLNGSSIIVNEYTVNNTEIL